MAETSWTGSQQSVASESAVPPTERQTPSTSPSLPSSSPIGPIQEQSDPLQEFRELFTSDSTMETAVRDAFKGTGHPLNDAELGTAMKQGNDYWMRHTNPALRQELHAAGLLHNPRFAALAYRISHDQQLREQHIERLESEIHKLRGARLGAPQGPSNSPRNARQLDTLELRGEIGRLSDKLTNGRLAYEEQQAALARLEELQQQLYE